MIRSAILCLFAAEVYFCGIANAELEGTFPAEGGPITIRTTAGPIQCGGLRFEALEGSLSSGSDPSPHAFFLEGNDKENATQVTIGSLGEAPELDGEITLDIHASPGAVIKGSWGKGVTPVPFEVNAVTEHDDAETQGHTTTLRSKPNELSVGNPTHHPIEVAVSDNAELSHLPVVLIETPVIYDPVTAIRQPVSCCPTSVRKRTRCRVRRSRRR